MNAIVEIFLITNSLNSIHFGKNPREGGIPARVKININLRVNSFSFLELFNCFFSITFMMIKTEEK